MLKGGLVERFLSRLMSDELSAVWLELAVGYLRSFPSDEEWL